MVFRSPLQPAFRPPFSRAFSNGASLPAWQRLQQSLFGNGEAGAYYPIHDLYTLVRLYQDTAGTTPATAVDDPVGRVDDLSGNGDNATQGTSTARMLLKQTAGGRWYLQSDKTDDALNINLDAFTGGTVVLVTTAGMWIDEGYDHAGGTFAIGPTSYTGGPAGLLALETMNEILGIVVIDRAITAGEKARILELFPDCHGEIEFSMLDLSPAALYELAAPYLYTDTEKTTEAVQGDKVRKVDDLSGNSHDLAPTNDTRRPIYTGIPVALGSEIAPALGDWTTGTGWSVADGVATKTAGTASSLSIAASLTAGQMYAIFINCTRTAGTVQVRFTGGTSVLGLAMNTNKSHTEYFVAGSGNTTIELYGDASFAGTVTRISVKPATEIAAEGLYFDGIDSFVISPNVDLSGGQQMTVAVSYWRDDRLGAAAPWEVGGYTALANHGSLQRIYGSSPSARSRDGSQGAAGFTYNHEGAALHSTRAITDFIDLDFSQAALQDQIKGETSGVPAPATYSGSALSVTALPTGPVALGAANNGASDFRGIIHRAAVIPRLLTATEKRDVDDWLMPGPRCGAIGDSTVGPNLIPSGQPSNAWRCSAFIPDAEFNYHDVTSPGDKIADQKTKWEALTDYSSLNAVFIQVGQNDANTYALSKTAAQIIADLQDLIDTVNGDVSASCKVYVCALTPAREWLGNSTDAAAAYAHWQAINEAIEGLGSNPIAGVDGRITGKSGGLYWAALNDGSDNLLQAYDHNDDGVHPSNEGKFIIAQAWREQLKADGLL